MWPEAHLCGIGLTGGEDLQSNTIEAGPTACQEIFQGEIVGRQPSAKTAADASRAHREESNRRCEKSSFNQLLDVVFMSMLLQEDKHSQEGPRPEQNVQELF